MSDDNKWSKPDAPPPPLFLGKKERDLVKQINDELVEKNHWPTSFILSN